MKSSAVSKGTILLFCSDSDVLSALRAALENASYLILPATGLDSAIDWLADCRPDLLIVSPYLDGISGHEAALFLRTKCNGLRVLIVAGMPKDDWVVDREAVSEVEIFPKPFAVAEFLEKVAEMLSPILEDEGNARPPEFQNQPGMLFENRPFDFARFSATKSVDARFLGSSLDAASLEGPDYPIGAA